MFMKKKLIMSPVTKNSALKFILSESVELKCGLDGVRGGALGCDGWSFDLPVLVGIELLGESGAR